MNTPSTHGRGYQGPIRKYAVTWGILLPAVVIFVALMIALARVRTFLPPDESTHPALHETWNLLSIAGKRIGVSHMRQWRADRDGRPVIITETQEQIRMLRQGESVQIEVAYRTEEAAAGELLSVRCMQRSEREQSIVLMGRIAKGQLHMKKQTAPSQPGRPEFQPGETTLTIDWPEGTHGYHGLERSLRNQMLMPGERRTMHCLVPLIDQIARLDLVAHKFESVEMASGPTAGLRVEVTSRLEDRQLPDRTLWVDAAGEVIKSLEPAMQLASERTTREVAHAETPAPQYDIIERSLVRVVPPWTDPFEKKRSVFLVTMSHGSPTDHFTQDRRQQIELLDTHRARITAKATWGPVGRGDPEGTGERQGTECSPPSDGSLASSLLIQSDDPRIVALALRVSSQQAGPASIALKLEQWVHGWIDKKGYQQVFSSASDVVASHQGDCTEHAVLLTAVCRARKIPARLVLGLVYAPEMQGFLFHMWTEAWWDGCWHPLDATLGRGGIGATHLKIRDFTLASNNVLTEMLAVSQVIGQLAIEVEESR